MSCSLEITSDLPVVVGSTIVGSVVCNFSKPTKIKGINLSFYGTEETVKYYGNNLMLYINERFTCIPLTHLFEGNESIIDIENVLVAIHVLFHGSEGTQTIGDTRDLNRGTNILVDFDKVVIDAEMVAPSGTTKYEFSVEVPERLPSSFKFYNGAIKYYLKATVKRSLRIDMTAIKEIEIIAYIDLNTYLPALQIQADYSTDRVVSQCCGLSRGRILLTAVIGKRLFLKGETIMLDLNIINLSGVRVKRIYSKIMKTITIYFKHPYPKEEIFRDFLTRSPYFQGVKGYSETTFTLHIEVPRDICIPNFRYSQLFKITYQLQVIANLSGCNTDMILQFKIYLGHRPFSAESFDMKAHILNSKRESASSIRNSL